MSNFRFDRGAADIIPTTQFAAAICKSLAPDGFLEEREMFLTGFQPSFHKQHYMGHDDVGAGPSEIIQSLFEFSNRNEDVQLKKGLEDHY